VIVVDVGASERSLHLAGIAAGNIEEGEGLWHGLERAMQNRPHFLMREKVGIHQLLIGRPLFLELLECGLVGDRSLGVEGVKVNVHRRPPLAPLPRSTAGVVL